MAFRIKPGEELPPAVKRMARAELRDAGRAIGDPRRPLAERIHDARTAIKKVRALDRLVRSAVGRPARRADRRLRKVAHAVSGARDAEVVLKTFDDFVADLDGRSSKPLAGARRDLAARLRASAGPLKRGGRVKRLRARLARERRKVKRWVPGADRWRAIGPGFEQGYRRARDAMATAYRSESGEDFHAWRRASKTHRHQVHALAPLAPGILNPRLKTLDRLGDLLGDEHDLTVLEQTIRDEKSCFPDERQRDRLLRLVGNRRLRLRRRAQSLGRALFAVRPSVLREHVKRGFRGRS